MRVTRTEHKCKIPVCEGVYCPVCNLHSKVQYEIEVATFKIALCPHCTRCLAAAINGELR